MTGIAVVAALSSEAFTYAQAKVPPNLPIPIGEHLLFLSGVGADRARQATDQLLNHQPQGIVSWGMAGALAPDLLPGTLVLPSSVVDHAAHQFSVDQTWHRSLSDRLQTTLPCIHEKLLSSDRVLDSPTTKTRAFEEHGAVAVDMESAAIAQTAERHRIPFIAVRSIVDTQSTVIPAAAFSGVDSFGRVKLFHLLQSLLAHPSQLADLWRLRNQARSAVNGLASVRRLAGASLACPFC